MLECLANPSNLGTHCPEPLLNISSVQSARVFMAIRETHPNGNHLVDAAGTIQKYSVDVDSSRPT